MRVIGFDPNGIKRCWGEAKTEESARLECKQAAREYVQRRPDTLPLNRWGFVTTDTGGEL